MPEPCILTSEEATLVRNKIAEIWRSYLRMTETHQHDPYWARQAKIAEALAEKLGAGVR
jgi:hypothetical protein